MLPPLIVPPEIRTLPLKRFEQTKVVVGNDSQLYRVFSELNQHDRVGFDTETRPSFSKGEYHPVSLVQLALPNKVFLFRVNLMELPQELTDYLGNSEITKIGVGIKEDLAALQKLAIFEPAGFIDLTQIGQKLGINNPGLRNLTAAVLGFRISKGQQTSNWENRLLTKYQIDYAATDAWACLQIYNELEHRGYLSLNEDFQ